MRRLKPRLLTTVALALAAGPQTRAGTDTNGPGAQQGQNNPSPSAPGESEKQQTTGSKASYKTERWQEDYSDLKDRPGNDFFDPIKYVPLGVDDWYATFGGQLRDRYENYNHNTFGSGPQDKDGYNLSRVLLDADLHFGPNLRVFAEGRGVWEDGRFGGPRGRDRDELDLEQGFADFMLPFSKESKLTLRVGRQELQFGAERLLGAADWSNARKNHDGVRLTYTVRNNQLDAFVTRPVIVDKYEFDNADNTTIFAGVYDTFELPDLMPGAKTKADAYVLYVQRNNQTIGSDGTGRTRRYTLGARLTGAPKPFDYDVEADYQGGTFRDEDVQAYSLAAEVGYNAPLELKPRAFLGFDVASGDRHPGGRMETFDQLFPSGHTFFGYMDFVGRQNVIDLHPGFDLTLAENYKFIEKLALRTEYHQFWRQSVNDVFYDTTSAVTRDNPTGTGSRNIGSELDLLLRWQVDRHLSSYVGYSHFFHGSYIQNTGPHKDVDFTYVAATYTF